SARPIAIADHPAQAPLAQGNQHCPTSSTGCYAEERYICTQVLFAQLFPGASKSLTSMCDRLVLDSSERDDRHGALLDADMTADALILLERQLKHGESSAPRSWTSASQA